MEQSEYDLFDNRMTRYSSLIERCKEKITEQEDLIINNKDNQQLITEIVKYRPDPLPKHHQMAIHYGYNSNRLPDKYHIGLLSEDTWPRRIGLGWSRYCDDDDYLITVPLYWLFGEGKEKLQQAILDIQNNKIRKEEEEKLKKAKAEADKEEKERKEYERLKVKFEKEIN